MKYGWLLIVGWIAGSVFLSHAQNQSPFACNRQALDPAARKRHFEELGPALAAIRKNTRELPDGYEFAFPPDPPAVNLLLEWAAGERLCCPFFDIEVRLDREGGAVKLRLTGRDGTKAFIRGDLVRWM
jgi:hypothetical protein